MNSDKQSNGHLAKPFTPTLSAAFHRSSKSPLTPKLANPGGYHTSKRYAYSEHPSSTVSSRDDLPATPGPTFLSANVTPRSGPRNTRRDGAMSSPTNTPSSNQPSPQTPFSQPVVAPGSRNGGYRTERSPARSAGKLEPARTTRAKTLTTENPHLPASPRPNSAYDISPGPQMFFHASDARSSTSSDQDPRPKPQSKSSPASTFVYANGEQERNSSAEESTLPIPPVKRRSIGVSRPVVPGKSQTLPSPRLKSPKLAESTARLCDELRSQISSHPDDVSELSSLQRGPPLLHSVPVVRHVKSASLDSNQHSASPREGLRPSPVIISPLPSYDENGSIGSEPIPGLRPRVFSNGSTASVDTHTSVSMLQSPVRTEGPRPPANDHALNARTERKILDLEISNSSLLAINRTLEREMRKQNAELRRYRRLSRSGRLSVANNSIRSFSGNTLSTTSEAGEEASEHSPSRSPEEMSDFSDEESVVDEDVLSPESLAEHDARHRAHDEKRFNTDISKHQELLVDSQKMNQSLKRCLGWTEELIKEAKKALEYSVHVNDIELGGRVLAPEEVGDIGESARGLLSPSNELTAMFDPIDIGSADTDTAEIGSPATDPAT